MAKVFYTFLTSATLPYYRMLKSIDGELSALAEFPFTISPATLRATAFSPDGKYLLAGRASAVAMNNNLRLWKMAKIDEFTEIPVTGTIPTTSVNIMEIAWLTDTHFVIVTNTAGTGTYFGVLDRNTDTVTITQVDNVAAASVACHPDGVHFVVVGGSIGSSPGYKFFQRTGDTAAVKSVAVNTVGAAPTLVRISPDGTLLAFAVSASPTFLVTKTLDAGVTTVGLVNIDSADQPTAVLTGLAFSPDGTHLYGGGNTIPRFFVWRKIGTRVIEAENGLPTPPVGSANKLFFTPDATQIVYVSSSNNTPYGRLRGFNRDPLIETLTDDTKWHDAVADWTVVLADATVSPEYEIGAVATVYDSAPEAIVSGSLNIASLKLALVNSSAAFDPTHTTLAQALGANEVYGSEWTQGGIALTGEGYVRGAAELYSLIGTVPGVDYTGAAELTFRSAVLYDDAHADKRPLAWFQFAEDQVAVQFDRMQFTAPGNRFVDLKRPA